MNSTNFAGVQSALPHAADAIRDAKSFVLACHVNPDGDALGSLLGMYQGLISLGKSDIAPMCQDAIPESLKFLPNSGTVGNRSSIDSFDLAIIVDSGDIERVGPDVLDVVRRARRTINIDHHVAAMPFGDIRLVDSAAASTAEIVYQLLLELNVSITEGIATCLFTGIITDTGSFRFQNVTPNTFRIAANLLESGAPPAVISEQVFENRTFASTSILGRCLSTLTQYSDGRVTVAKISLTDFLETGAVDADSEGIVNYVRGVRGAHVGILLREIAGHQIRASLRSRDTIDVSKIAQVFGGGGHRMASGCTINGTLDHAESEILDQVRKQLDL